MWTAEQLAARASVLAQLNANLEALRDDLASFDGALLGMGFIVVSAAGQAIQFAIDELGHATNPRQTIAKLATRFDRTDAEHVALLTKDGNGNPARAMHVTDAIRAQIASTEKCIAELETL